MSELVRLIRKQGEVADVRPEWVDDWIAQGWKAEGGDEKRPVRKPRAQAAVDDVGEDG